MNEFPSSHEQDLEAVMRRLASKIAARFSPPAFQPLRATPHSPVRSPSPQSPPSGQSAAPHPSLDRFTHADAVSELLEFLGPKPCVMEKGRPCDHCDICTTRGF